ncbi:MAG: hypothetical protein IPK98_19180 [Chloracidobacterium sp.]|nr:hypothetical protein [Chloracidobacterium sp.]
MLSNEFVRQAKTPTPVQPTYGFMNWFLNTDKKLYPNAPTGIVVTRHGTTSRPRPRGCGALDREQQD